MEEIKWNHEKSLKQLMKQKKLLLQDIQELETEDSEMKSSIMPIFTRYLNTIELEIAERIGNDKRRSNPKS
jgi:hypothetical protein